MNSWPPKDTPFMTVYEVAAKLRVSNISVYRLIWERQIDHYVIGDSIRIPVREFDRISQEGVEYGQQAEGAGRS